MAVSEEENRDFWWCAAGRTARRINLGWWLDRLAMPLLVGSIIASAATLLLRRLFPVWPMEMLVGGGILVITGISLATYFRARKHFETTENGLTRLEANLGLHNALHAAEAGICPWPEKIGTLPSGSHWNWPRLVIPLLGSLALFCGGWFLPISKILPPAKTPDQPIAWQKLDAELQRLADEKLVDEPYLEETREKLDDLKSQEEQQWFSHSSLEATDALEKSHQAESQRVQDELENARKALEALDATSGKSSQEEQKKQLDSYEKALQGLQNGAMKPNPQLLEQMKQLNPDTLRQLTPEQMQQLKENLQKQAQAMKNGQGNGLGQGENDDWSDELLSGDQENNGKSPGQGKPGDKPGSGKGGIDRGPGHDPNLLGDGKDGTEIGDLTGLNAEDLSRATPGDLLELQNGEHVVEQKGTRIQSGGTIDATGKGGDRVWKESLDPAEQRAIKRFFE
ncbi:MAG: hypothetical protein QM680_13285 [Luteolibacter sp.]